MYYVLYVMSLNFFFLFRECAQGSLIASLTGSVRAPESSNNNESDVVTRFKLRPSPNLKMFSRFFCDRTYLTL